LNQHQHGGRALPGLLFFMTIGLGLTGCSGARGSERSDGPAVQQPDRTAASPSDSQTVRPSVTHIDSILPIEEEIRRFRARVPETPKQLSGGARSRDALVHQWVRAMETRDSIALGHMLLNAAEFITLYYPESPYTHPPYRQSPEVRWQLITNTSMQGASRVWTRHAGMPMGFTGYRCDPKPEIVGRNKVWTGCVVEWKNGSGQGTVRLFGPIIERDGEFKFLTYASDY